MPRGSSTTARRTHAARRPRVAPEPAFRLHGTPADEAARATLYRRLGAGVIAAFTLLLLLIALGPHQVGDYFTETDFYGAYADGARALQRGQVDASRYGVVGPGYEAVLALVGFVVPNLFLAAELISMVSVAGALLLWFLLLERRAGGLLALIATLFLAANPHFIRYGYSATTDGLALGLQAAALYLLLVRSGSRAALAAGGLAGLAFLTRYSAITLLPAGLIAIAAGGTLHPRRARAALFFALGFALPVVPWIAWSLAHGARFASQLHHNIAYDVFARSKGIVWDDYQEKLQPQFRSLWDVIARDPVAVLSRELFNVWDHLRLDAVKLMGLPMAIAAAVGLGFAALDGTLRRLWPVLLAAGLLFLALVPAFYSERYSLPILPAYAALAAAAFASPYFAIAFTRRRLWLKPALMLVPLALTITAGTKTLRYVLSQLPVEVLETSAALRAAAGPGDRLMARKPHAAWHAGVAAVPFPFTRTLPELAEAARRERARWLFFSWPEAEMRPQYAYLLDTSAVVPGLRVHHASTVRPAVLYEIGPDFGVPPAWIANDTLRIWHDARARLQVNPNDLEALMALAFIHIRREQPADALPMLERAVRLRPGEVRGWLLLGETQLHLEDPLGAIASYEQAERIQPGNLDARLGRGWAAVLQRQPQQAALLWRPVVRMTRDPVTLLRMIDVYRAVGDPAAVAEAQAALAQLSAGRSTP
jgi:tetratricopeptide (TPR) repeat protein